MVYANSDKKVLVAYYSRTGITKKVAGIIKENIDCDLDEVIDKVNRRGVFGFIKSAYAAFKGRSTEIENTKHDVSEYDLIIIGTPVWAGRMSCAARRFLEINCKDIKKIAFFATKGGNTEDDTFKDMEMICGIKPIGLMEITGDLIKNGEYVNEINKFMGEIIAKL